MVWTWKLNRNYALALTAGYVEDPSSPKLLMHTRVFGPEQAMANHLYHREIGLSIESPLRESLLQKGYLSEKANVWIIGKPNWLRDAPLFFRQLAENTTNADYRVVIVGFNIGMEDKPTFFDHGCWLRQIGMTKKHKPVDSTQFKKRSLDLLENMLKYRNEKKEAPTKVLTDFEIPVSYAGASR